MVIRDLGGGKGSRATISWVVAPTTGESEERASTLIALLLIMGADAVRYLVGNVPDPVGKGHR